MRILSGWPIAMNVESPDLRFLCEQALKLHQAGQEQKAEQLYLQILAAGPSAQTFLFTARHMLGVIRFGQRRYDEAIELIGSALKANPGAAELLVIYGLAFRAAGRHQEALEQFGKALALNPGNPGALNNYGITLQRLGRFEEALAQFDKALALKPDLAEAWHNRGITLRNLRRMDEALADFDKAAAINPHNAEIWNSRGAALHSLMRLDDALTSLNTALALNPDLPGAMRNLGEVLCESGRVEEGLAVFRRHAELLYGAGIAPGSETKIRHDREQRDYIAETDGQAAIRPFRLLDGARLTTRAVHPDNAQHVTAQWKGNHPQIAVIDNFLTDEALNALRRFCWGSTIWQRIYKEGYLGAMPEHGFACPLLAQIAQELRTNFPAIFEEHPLCYLWGFKYDSGHSGIDIHADAAAVNVNFWITPDEANLNPERGGMVIWDIAAPANWDFEKFNGDSAASHDFIARTGAKPMIIPYRANRAVIFDSDLFHKTDEISFKEGYLNRRINVTFLYGRRIPKGQGWG